MGLVKVVCETCGGDGYWEEEDWDTGKIVKVICLACNSNGYLEYEEYKE